MLSILKPENYFMISIVVCSIKKELFKNLGESIKTTIGIPDYELIKIDNTVEKLSIAKAYNKGLSQARNEIVVFVHEDVIFHTQGWGRILFHHFEANPRAGLIGVAGTKLKLRAPSTLYDAKGVFYVANILQWDQNKKVKHDSFGWRNNTEVIQEIVAADGVFLALRKAKGVRFDERVNGFHGYDIAISLSYKTKGWSVFAVNDLLIEHFSQGTINKDWVEAMERLYRLYHKKLPQNLTAETNLRLLEILAFERFIKLCLNLGERKTGFRNYLRLLKLQPLIIRRYLQIRDFIG